MDVGVIPSDASVSVPAAVHSCWTAVWMGAWFRLMPLCLYLLLSTAAGQRCGRGRGAVRRLCVCTCCCPQLLDSGVDGGVVLSDASVWTCCRPQLLDSGVDGGVVLSDASAWTCCRPQLLDSGVDGDVVLSDASVWTCCCPQLLDSGVDGGVVLSDASVWTCCCPQLLDSGVDGDVVLDTAPLLFLRRRRHRLPPADWTACLPLLQTALCSGEPGVRRAARAGYLAAVTRGQRAESPAVGPRLSTRDSGTPWGVTECRVLVGSHGVLMGSH